MSKTWLKSAKVFSNIFSPHHLCLIMVLLWAICGVMPLPYFAFLRWVPIVQLIILIVLTIVYPVVSIHLYRRMNRWPATALCKRENRYMPYLLTLLSYITCQILFHFLYAPFPLLVLLNIAVITIFLCYIINFLWKISAYMAGCGAFVGVIFAIGFSGLANGVNMLWLICLSLLISGALGTIRLIFHVHSLAQVLIGFLVGLISSWLGLLTIACYLL